MVHILKILTYVICSIFVLSCASIEASNPELSRTGVPLPHSEPDTESVPAEFRLSGTYTLFFYGFTMSMEFSGSSFTYTLEGEHAGSGDYTISGSLVYLNNNSIPFFTIIDENTLIDSDGDIWIKESLEQGILSGLFSFSFHGTELTIEFSGENFVLRMDGDFAGSGTYRYTETLVYLNNNVTPFFTVIDSSTFMDAEGNIWLRN